MVLICFFLEYDNIGTPTDIQKCSNGFEFRFDSQGSLIHLKDPASQVAPTLYLFMILLDFNLPGTSVVFSLQDDGNRKLQSN